tara:strand:- start:9 stop:476 length:468 start_codon:yes stop_codon:yes gene_type:complete
MQQTNLRISTVVFLFGAFVFTGLMSGCLSGQLVQPEEAPLSDAGYDQVLFLGSESSITVNLDGRASCDPGGFPISAAAWALLEAPGISSIDISSVGTLQGFFEASTPGIYLLSLTVTADERESAPDFVEITIREGNGENDPGTLPETDACGNNLG